MDSVKDYFSLPHFLENRFFGESKPEITFTRSYKLHVE